MKLAKSRERTQPIENIKAIKSFDKERQTEKIKSEQQNDLLQKGMKVFEAERVF